MDRGLFSIEKSSGAKPIRSPAGASAAYVRERRKSQGLRGSRPRRFSREAGGSSYAAAPRRFREVPAARQGKDAGVFLRFCAAVPAHRKGACRYGSESRRRCGRLLYKWIESGISCNRPCVRSRYWLGVMPVFFLKAMLNRECYANPRSFCNSLQLSSEMFCSSFRLFIFSSSRYCAGANPTYCRKSRRNRE